MRNLAYVALLVLVGCGSPDAPEPRVEIASVGDGSLDSESPPPSPEAPEAPVTTPSAPLEPNPAPEQPPVAEAPPTPAEPTEVPPAPEPAPEPPPAPAWPPAECSAACVEAYDLKYASGHGSCGFGAEEYTDAIHDRCACNLYAVMEADGGCGTCAQAIDPLWGEDATCEE